MAEPINFTELIIAILPFIFGIIAIALVPAKEKILKGDVNSYPVEVLIVVYIIALFILILGFYYFMSIFAEQSKDQLIKIVNGVFLEVIALGIMGLNYRNYSEFSHLESDIQLAERVEPYEVGEYAGEVSPITTEPTQVKPEILECPGCGKTITITVPKRPIKIQCPHCGIEGIIR